MSEEKMIITAKLNVSLVDKTKLFKGEKGTYLDITLIESKNDKYGNDFMVVQNVSKEDRLAGKKGAILGNAKIYRKGAARSGAPSSASGQSSQGFNDGGTPPF